MNTKEQLEVVDRYAGWGNYIGPFHKTTMRNDIEAIEESDPHAYAALMPEWVRVRNELKAIRDKASTATVSDPEYLNVARAKDHLGNCSYALTDGTLSDFLLSLSNAILWIESTKQK